MAQLTLTMDVTMDAVAADRAGRPAEGRPGYTDYVMAAVAGALVEHPVVNSQIADGALNLLPQVNVGLAVALDGGLVVPVVHGIDSLSFDELCAETTRLADAARARATGPRRGRGGDVLGHRPRHVRRGRVHARDQPAEHGHPGCGADP